MKSYKTLISEIQEASKPEPKKSGKDTIAASSRKKRKVSTEDKPKGLLGLLGTIGSGAVAAAHRHLIHPAHAKYGYQPITDYMKGFGKKKKVYIETDD